MANDPKLKARLELDTTQATRAMKDAESKLANSAKNIATSFIGPTAALAGFTELIRQSVSASLEHERVMVRVQAAGVRNVAAFDSWAESLQRVSGVSSDVIANQAAITKSLGSSEEQAKLFTEASLELAAALGRDLASVQNQLNKTLGGTLGELAELVPSMKSLTVEQLKAGEAAQFLMQQFGGSAAAQGGTAAGQIAIVNESFGDLKQSIGDLTIAIVGQGASAGGGAGGAVGAFDSWAGAIGSVKDALNELRPFEKIVQMLTGGFREDVGRIRSGVSNFRRFYNALNPQIQTDPTVGIRGLSPESMVGVGGALPVVITNVSEIRGIGAREFPTADITDRFAARGAIDPVTGMPTGLPFEQPRMTGNDWLEEEARQREYIRDLTEQSMNTLTQSLLDSIFYARDLSDVFKNLLRDIVGSVAQQGVKAFVASIIPGASVATAGGGSYSIGPSDNNPALQQQARELSRQMNKSRRRGF